ncbi:hypothetical protein, partial [Massilicoli timonensis]|uniref:hypothetical protein n=1 Tax=Massilicoli timonensis TaxID=2015901 RepID=UPI003AAF4B11
PALPKGQHFSQNDPKIRCLCLFLCFSSIFYLTFRQAFVKIMKRQMIAACKVVQFRVVHTVICGASGNFAVRARMSYGATPCMDDLHLLLFIVKINNKEDTLCQE